MVDIKELFEYNWHCRRAFLKGFEELPWDEVVADRGASFGSMRDIFLHSLAAEHDWLSDLARGKVGTSTDYDPDRDFGDIAAIVKYVEKVEADDRAYLQKLGPSDLSRQFPLRAREGPDGVLTVEDILVHVVEEEIHHRGELLCLMWQIEIEPPNIDYIDYTVERKRKWGDGPQVKPPSPKTI